MMGLVDPLAKFAISNTRMKPPPFKMRACNELPIPLAVNDYNVNDGLKLAKVWLF